MSYLSFFYSTMNAGKTTQLLQHNHTFLKNKFNTILFIPDIAHKNGIIKSRIGLKKTAIKITDNFNIFKYIKQIKKKINYILIDEAQFLKKKHIFELISIVDILNISVLTYGLKTDFKSKLFEGSKYLLALSDKLIEIKTLCLCGKKAIMNAKINTIGKKVLYGKQVDINKENYIPVCRFHYYNLKKLHIIN